MRMTYIDSEQRSDQYLLLTRQMFLSSHLLFEFSAVCYSRSRRTSFFVSVFFVEVISPASWSLKPSNFIKNRNKSYRNANLEENGWSVNAVNANGEQPYAIVRRVTPPMATTASDRTNATYCIIVPETTARLKQTRIIIRMNDICFCN